MIHDLKDYNRVIKELSDKNRLRVYFPLIPHEMRIALILRYGGSRQWAEAVLDGKEPWPSQVKKR